MLTASCGIAQPISLSDDIQSSGQRAAQRGLTQCVPVHSMMAVVKCSMSHGSHVESAMCSQLAA